MASVGIRTPKIGREIVTNRGTYTQRASVGIGDELFRPVEPFGLVFLDCYHLDMQAVPPRDPWRHVESQPM